MLYPLSYGGGLGEFASRNLRSVVEVSADGTNGLAFGPAELLVHSARRDHRVLPLVYTNRRGTMPTQKRSSMVLA